MQVRLSTLDRGAEKRHLRDDLSVVDLGHDVFQPLVEVPRGAVGRE